MSPAVDPARRQRFADDPARGGSLPVRLAHAMICHRQTEIMRMLTVYGMQTSGN